MAQAVMKNPILNEKDNIDWSFYNHFYNIG
jgi:hypothetical protein